MAPATFMRIADRNAAEVGLDRIVDVVFFDLVELNVVLIDGKAKTRRAITTGHIIVDDEGHLTEDIAQLNRNRASNIRIVAVNLGKQRGDDRRPRRNFDHFHDRTFGMRKSFQRAARRAQSCGWCDAVRLWARD